MRRRTKRLETKSPARTGGASGQTSRKDAPSHPLCRWYGVAIGRSSNSWRAQYAKRNALQAPSEALRHLLVVRVCEFVGVRRGQHTLVVEHPPDNLQAHRQAVLRKTAWHARRWLLGQVEG